MFVNISVHRIRPDKEPQMIDSMRRFGETAKAAGGLQRIHTLKDEKTGALIGLAIWDSKDAYEAAQTALMKAVEGDDFGDWHEADLQSFHCFEA